MVNINNYGLKRYIPSEQKRKIRKNSGFGCCICGEIPYEYEHVDPEFKDAKEHDSSKITLLCGSCHSKVTRKIISKETVKKHMKLPYNIKNNCVNGYEIEVIPELGDFKIKLGNITGINVKNFLCVDGEPLLSLSKSEGNEYCILNADFKDKNGKSILKIVDNEWNSNLDNWDIECIGPKITIRDKNGTLDLVLNKKETNFIEIERINMKHRDIHIYYDGKNGEEIIYNGFKMRLQGIEYRGSDHALRFQNGEIQLHSNGSVILKGISFYKSN